jgi:geranylgeranyl pyrophosphate synthase
LEKYDAIEYARQTALGLVDQARRQISELPQSASRDTLLAMSDFVVQRST